MPLPSATRRYGVAVVSVAVTTALRAVLQGVLGTRSIYTFYFIALTVSTFYGGRGAGIAALIISAIVATWLFVPPAFVLTLNYAADWIGLVAYLVAGGTIIAVTASQRAARRRGRESESRYRELVESSEDLIWAFDLDGRMTFVNDEASRIVFGYSAREMIDRPWAEFAVREEGDALAAKFAAVLAGESLRHIPVTALGRDGAKIDLLVNAVPTRNAGGKIVGVTGTSVDVTSQRVQERKFEVFRSLMDHSADGILIIAERTRTILDVNQTFCTWLDYPEAELLGRRIEDIVVPHPTLTWEERQLESYRMGHDTSTPTPVVEAIYLRRDGTQVPREVGFRFVESGGTEVIVAVVRDVSERKRLEQQLQHSQKMEGIGRLAGGIAHDFNNLLTAISGYTELAIAALPEGDPVCDDLAQVANAAARAAALTGQLLAFARKQVIQPRLVSVNTLVSGLRGLLVRLLGEDVVIRTHLADELWLINIDPGQFEQILVNLAVNARDAMPAGGILLMETANVILGDDYARKHPELIPGEYVRLAVTDSGIGMDAKIQERLFEPFFTTKPAGKGTGLGLATTHGIVRQNGGHIWVYSEPGKGSTFKIYLPRATEGIAAAVVPAPSPAVTGNETVLVVEDEELVRSFAVVALRRLGYQTLDAGGGAEALELARAHAGKIHLLMTDVVMPDLNGRMVAERLLKIHPETRVLYASGYTDDTIIHHGMLESGVDFLQKPYSITELASKVRLVLDAVATPPNGGA
ncbi:MAG: PAS domain S-box protein [Gemmatimonadota bacterium]